MAQLKPDALTDVDAILAEADIDSSPWSIDSKTDERVYVPDFDLLNRLFEVPISKGYADEQNSGRVARTLDAWVAQELRRCGFPETSVFPRRRRPRVLAEDLAPIEEQIDLVLDLFDKEEARLSDEAGKTTRLKPIKLRNAIAKLRGLMEKQGQANSNILGRFYTKEVDVVVSDWRRGPDILISTKTQFSSFGNNKNNRYEEAIGEAQNLRDRYPMAAMGYVYVVRSTVLEKGVYAFLRDLLVRLRKPDGPLDAAMLLVGTWDENNVLEGIEEASGDTLSVARFFSDIVTTTMNSTPVHVHEEIRRRHLGGEPEGGFPDPGVEVSEI